jgi:hypothetical protein
MEAGVKNVNGEELGARGTAPIFLKEGGSEVVV